MFKYFVITLLLIASIESKGFLDSIAETGKETARGAVLAGSVAGLLEESIVGVQQAKSVIELKEKIDKINKQVNQIKDLDENTRRILKGVDYNEADELSKNINKTTDYIRLVKKTLTTLCVMSPDSCSAVTGITTNNQLNQIIQNQNQEAIERQKEKTEIQQRRINLYTGIKNRLEVKSKLSNQNSISNQTAKLAINLYNASFNIMQILLPVIFLGTIVFFNFFGSAEDQLSNFKNLVIYMVIAYGFKILLPILIDMPYLLNQSFKSDLTLKFDETLQKYVVSEQSSFLSFDVISIIEGIVQLLETVVQIFVDFLFVFLALVAPIIIMLSVMLNLGVGVKLLFGLMFILGTWNIAIVATDLMVKEAITSDWNLSAFLMSLFGVIMKILAGASNLLLALKSPVGGAVFGKSLGVMANGIKSIGAKSSNAATAMGLNPNMSLDEHLMNEALKNPATQAGTKGGELLADRKLAMQQAAYEDMRNAYKKAGIQDPEVMRKEREAKREQDKKDRDQANAERQDNQKFARAAKILSDADKSPERLEGFKGGSADDLIKYSNDRTKAAVNSRLASILEQNNSLGSHSSETSNSDKSSVNMSELSTEQVASNFDNAKADLETLDSGLDYMKNNKSEYTPEQTEIISSERQKTKAQVDSYHSELLGRESLGDNEATEFLETGHITKKKGRN